MIACICAHIFLIRSVPQQTCTPASRGWDLPISSNGILLVIQIFVSIKHLFRLERGFPWPRPERCPRSGYLRLWGHGFVSAYFDGYVKRCWLKRYRCLSCGVMLRLRPSGYFKRFQSSIETIRQSEKKKGTLLKIIKSFCPLLFSNYCRNCRCPLLK